IELLPRFGQFVLAVLQRIGHGVKRTGDSFDFRVTLNIHAPAKFTQPPSVRGVNQLRKRALDEPLAAPPREGQDNQGARNDEQRPAPGAIFDHGESLRLTEAEADKQVVSHSGVSDYSAHAVNVSYVSYGPVVESRIFTCGQQLAADERAIV